jgi:hypothetical protein
MHHYEKKPVYYTRRERWSDLPIEFRESRRS